MPHLAAVANVRLLATVRFLISNQIGDDDGPFIGVMLPAVNGVVLRWRWTIDDKLQRELKLV